MRLLCFNRMFFIRHKVILMVMGNLHFGLTFSLRHEKNQCQGLGYENSVLILQHLGQQLLVTLVLLFLRPTVPDQFA